MSAKQSHRLFACYALCLAVKSRIVLRGNIPQDGTDKGTTNLPPTLTNTAINNGQQYVGFIVFNKDSTRNILQAETDSSCYPY